MAKANAWDPKHVEMLRNVPRNDDTKKELTKLAVKLKRTYNSIYWKWWSIQDEKQTESYEAMVFIIDTSITTPKRADSADVIRMKKGLDLVIPKLPVNGGSIPIPNKFSGSAKKHLEDKYGEMRFSFSRIKERGRDTGTTRIFRKA